MVRLDLALEGLAVSTAYGIWNAVNDPLVGYLSERIKSRWGRKTPCIMFGTPLAALLFRLVWTPPAPEPLGESYDLAMLAYLTVVLALFDLAYTVVSAPPHLPLPRDVWGISLAAETIRLLITAL